MKHLYDLLAREKAAAEDLATKCLAFRAKCNPG